MKTLRLPLTLLLLSFMLPSKMTEAEVPGFGNSRASGLSTLTASSSIIVNNIIMEQDRSYECTVLTDTDSDAVTLDFINGSAVSLDRTVNKIRDIGDLTPPVFTGAGAADNRLTIQPAVPVSTVTRLKITNTTASTITYEQVCTETTLYGGYNTNANPFNFLELTNTTSGTITARVRGFNFDGTATVNTSVSIAPGTRFDIDIHTAAGANKYGSLIVTHDGPFGALLGYVSQYSGSPSSLVLTGSIPLRSRVRS